LLIFIFLIYGVLSVSPDVDMCDDVKDQTMSSIAMDSLRAGGSAVTNKLKGTIKTFAGRLGRVVGIAKDVAESDHPFKTLTEDLEKVTKEIAVNALKELATEEIGKTATEMTIKISSTIMAVRGAIKKAKEATKAEWDNLGKYGKAQVIAMASWYPTLKGIVDILKIASADKSFKSLNEHKDAIDKAALAVDLLGKGLKEVEKNIDQLSTDQVVVFVILGASKPLVEIIIEKAVEMTVKATSLAPVAGYVSKFTSAIVMSAGGDVALGSFCYAQHSYVDDDHPNIRKFVIFFNPGCLKDPVKSFDKNWKVPPAAIQQQKSDEIPHNEEMLEMFAF